LVCKQIVEFLHYVCLYHLVRIFNLFSKLRTTIYDVNNIFYVVMAIVTFAPVVKSL